MDKKTKILIFIAVSFFFLLFIFSIFFTQRRFQILNKKIENLQNMISQKNNGQLSRNNGNGGPIELGQGNNPFDNSLQDNPHFLGGIAGRLEDLFPEDLDKDFIINLGNNGLSSIHSQMQFSNTTIINGTKFSYTFTIKDGELKGIVMSDDSDKLENLKNSIKKLNVTIISSTDEQFEFEAGKEITPKLLQLFNIKMK